MEKKNNMSFYRFVFGLLISVSTTCIWAQDRPNIVWLVSEDNSVHFLRMYNPHGASMPHVEKLAAHGITYRHAFSNGPVCSVARSTLISSCYAPRIGAQYHRRSEKVPMPEGIEMFPYYLRQAGYYTTNNSKEDYNILRSDEVWDVSSREASYKNRAEGQSFFHVQNFGTTHEGQLHFTLEEMRATPTTAKPDSMVLFPYHVQTSLSQYTYARYHDLHQKVDQQIGDFLADLEAEGLMDNTFIFYYGDHGGVLPRSKGYVYESGLHVPLVVYVPEKWQNLIPTDIGASEDAFVSFIDFGPTVLNLAGVEAPSGIDGRAFLGEGVTRTDLDGRNTAFGYADRFDEKYDHVRSFRKGKYKYIRNYQPFNFDGLMNNYRYRMQMYQEWQMLYETGFLSPNRSQFYESRAVEQLFDLESDPHEVNNLADDPKYQEILLDMRKAYQQQLDQMRDLSFFPEPYFLENGLQNPLQFGQDQTALITELRAIADLQLLPFKEARKQIQTALKSENFLHRYWGLIVCSSFGKEADPFFKRAKNMTQKDPSNLVRVRAAEFLALSHGTDPASVLLDCLKDASSPVEANLILNTVVLLQDGYSYEFDIKGKELFPEAWFSDKSAQFHRRLLYLEGE